MIDVKESAGRIFDVINESTEGLDYNDRAAMLLFVKEFITCAVELDILDTLRPKKKKTCRMERVKEFPDTDCRFECWKCSKCGRTNREQNPNYCPKCGARVVDV